MPAVIWWIIIITIDVKVGDYALVHAGLIIQVLDDDEAQSMIDLFKELEDIEIA